jgi:asparagine synthase (glutamine-hydrolysing)
MCGICGVISADPRQVEPAVRRMMQSMVHRGPDDEGYEELPLGGGDGGPTAGFGFRRLSIQDLSVAGHQPMFNSRTGDCLIFNGEIYNFRSLRTELQLQGVLFRSQSDTEVLLQALSTWGEAAVEKIQGMYAFAFYHAASRRILLGRDPLGIKPLYVARLRDGVVFASEIRAIRASGMVPDDLDVAGIASMLAYGAIQSPLTIHEKIRSFPAGAIQWIDGQATPPVPARRFWTFPRKHVDHVDVKAAADDVQRLMREAVLRHLVADVPVGVFLSAGIDSTIVASFAREFTPKVTSFTVGFGSLGEDDESEVAAATAANLGIRHIGVQVDASTLPDAWHDWLASVDSPSIDGFNTYLVSRQLAVEGVVVGLSGLGADELFGGYSIFGRAPRWSRMLRALAFVPPPLRSNVVSSLGRLDGRFAAYEKFADIISGDFSVAGITRSLRRALSNNRLAALGLSPTEAGVANDYLPLPPERWDPPLDDDDDFNTVSRVEMVHYMGDTLLRDTDANSMRHSLEVRVPFLDLPLVDYVSALPGSIKHQTPGVAKSLLRRACRQVLPDAVTRRQKTGFTLPIGFWIRNQMRDPCEAAIERLERSSVVDGAEVRRVWNEFLAHPRSMHWSRPLSLVVLGNAIG